MEEGVSAGICTTRAIGFAADTATHDEEGYSDSGREVYPGLSPSRRRYEKGRRRVDVLMKYHWRKCSELKNIIERLVIMTPTGVITKCDILPFFEEGKGEVPRDDLQITSDSFRAAKQEFERQYIVRKLREYNGNISRTAEAIGLERSNLHKKIRSYELDVKNGSDKGTED